MDGQMDGRKTNIGTKLIYPSLLKKKADINSEYDQDKTQS